MKVCETSGKTCFSSAEAARRARRGLGNRIRTYFCRDCKSFHITNGEQ